MGGRSNKKRERSNRVGGRSNKKRERSNRVETDIAKLQQIMSLKQLGFTYVPYQKTAKEKINQFCHNGGASVP